MHLEGLLEEGETLPEPRSIERHKSNPDYAGGVWAVVSIDPSRVPARAARVNITMPRRVLEAVDRYARQHGDTRSGLLARAAAQYIRTRKT